MKIIFLLAFSLSTFQLFSQFERVDIISKKIKSITTSYWAPDSSRKIETKKYYTVQGDDSLEYYCGKLSFSYKTILAGNGKVKRLERYDAVAREDELHMYKYEKNGSYSIEIVAQGAGTILFSKYDKYNKCLEQTFSGVEALHYDYDSSGKLKKILYNKENGKPVEIASVIYNNEGFMEKIIGTDSPQQIQYFKYNNFGLVLEKKSVRNDENGKEEKQIVFYEYEFRK